MTTDKGVGAVAPFLPLVLPPLDVDPLETLSWHSPDEPLLLPARPNVSRSTLLPLLNGCRLARTSVVKRGVVAGEELAQPEDEKRGAV